MFWSRRWGAGTRHPEESSLENRGGRQRKRPDCSPERESIGRSGRWAGRQDCRPRRLNSAGRRTGKDGKTHGPKCPPQNAGWNAGLSHVDELPDQDARPRLHWGHALRPASGTGWLKRAGCQSAWHDRMPGAFLQERAPLIPATGRVLPWPLHAPPWLRQAEAPGRTAESGKGKRTSLRAPDNRESTLEHRMTTEFPQQHHGHRHHPQPKACPP